MDIECTLKRDGGSKIDLVTREYHFTPRADGAQVADVEDEQHIARLLAIPEAYRIYRAQPASAVMAVDFTDSAPAKPQLHAATAPELAHVALLGSAGHPDTFTIHGVTYTQSDIVNRAVKSFNTADWNALTDDTRGELLDEVLDDLQDNPAQPAQPVEAVAAPVEAPVVAPVEAPAPAPTPVDPDAERAALSEQYQAKFGKKPHYQWKAEKIRAELDKPAS